MRTRIIALLSASLLLVTAMPAGAQKYNASKDKTVQKIIEIGQNDNTTMEIEDFIANRIGGRIVGSDALQHAEKWVAQQFKSWGLEVMVQEVGEINVGFNRGPWFGRMLGEGDMALHFATPSYTAGTKGPQKGHVVVEPKTQREFDRIKGLIKGAWVLVGGKSNGFPVSAETKDADGNILVPFFDEMVKAGALGFIQSSDVPMRILYDRAHCYDITMDNLPTVCDIKLDSEQYDIIYKKAKERRDFLLEFDIRNYFYEGPVKYHNVIGIIRGSKYPNEYVLTGGHLDAFDGATGAIDDAQGTAVTMESARLIALSGAKPLRTMMFCIWTAEEYGLLGSKFFVESGVAPMGKISNYFNRDGGPEVAVSVTVPPAMYDDFVNISAPLANLNPEFPFTVNKNESEPRPRPTTAGGSDHAYFAMNGVPTISLDLRDVKGYGFDYGEIWHSERDMYNKTIPEYMEHSAIVNAVMVYGLANLDHILDRTGLYAD